MTRKKLTAAACTLLSLALAAGLLTGCGNAAQSTASTQTASAAATADMAQGGTIFLKVNPEIAVRYDSEGKVTSLEGRNQDGRDILNGYTGYEGKDCKTVIGELVARINEGGYFVEEVEGDKRQITLEIARGSSLPSNDFLSGIVEEVQTYTAAQQIASPVEVDGESNYGWTNYGDTDYGPDNDGVTDYGDTDYGPNNDGVTDYTAPASTSGAAGKSGPNTSYDDTDYGPNNDGVTDYNDTDYGPNNDGVTDYNDTDYGPNNDGVTDYNDTDYGPNNDGVTDYDDTDYGPSNDGVTDYAPAPTAAPAPAPTAPPAPATGGDSNYDDGNTNYDDGNTNYDDGGDSGYDD